MGMLCSIPDKENRSKSPELIAVESHGAAVVASEESTTTLGIEMNVSDVILEDCNDNSNTIVDKESNDPLKNNYTMSGAFGPVMDTPAKVYDEITFQNIAKLDGVEKHEYSHATGSGVELELIPHIHTLFCERKQRVCGSVGKIQQLEYVRLIGNIDDILEGSIMWMRSASENTSLYADIPSSEGLHEYHFGLDDVGCFVTARYTSVASGSVSATAPIGPVLPGPPRYTKVGVCGDLWNGGYATVSADYIGGYEGASEYWWLRIRDGVREQVRDQLACDPLTSINTDPDVMDPRVYHLTADDVGCILKVKIRPVRSDGFKGEIFTSLPSTIISAHSPESILDLSPPCTSSNCENTTTESTDI